MNSIDPARTYTSTQVATLVFCRQAKWFYRHRARLERAEGFPPPISSIGQPLWLGATLLAWMDRTRAPRPANDPAPMATPAPKPWAAVLRRRIDTGAPS